MQKRKIRNMPWQEGFPQSITAQSAANPSNVPSPWASACERQKALGEKVTVQISDGPALLPWSSPANIVPSGNIGQAVLGKMAFLVFAVI
jgi:hypothetical protein